MVDFVNLPGISHYTPPVYHEYTFDYPDPIEMIRREVNSEKPDTTRIESIIRDYHYQLFDMENVNNDMQENRLIEIFSYPLFLECLANSLKSVEIGLGERIVINHIINHKYVLDVQDNDIDAIRDLVYVLNNDLVKKLMTIDHVDETDAIMISIMRYSSFDGYQEIINTVNTIIYRCEKVSAQCIENMMAYLFSNIPLRYVFNAVMIDRQQRYDTEMAKKVYSVILRIVDHGLNLQSIDVVASNYICTLKHNGFVPVFDFTEPGFREAYPRLYNALVENWKKF